MNRIGLATIALVATGCVSAALRSDQGQVLPAPTSKQVEASLPVQQAMNEFTFRLTREVLGGDSKPNVCISPLSVSVCLSTLLNAAQHGSYDDLRRTLSYDKLSLDQINGGSYATIAQLLNAKENPFTIANSVWLRTDFPAKPSYVNTLQRDYDADFYGVKRFDREVVDRINRWTGDKTKGRIEKLFDQLDPEQTCLVLVNALTFDGDWKIPFDKEATRPAPFHVGDAKETADRPTMHANLRVPFYEKGGSKALRLSYKGDEYSMVFVLPPSATTAKQYLSELKGEAFRGLLKGLQHGSEKVSIALPKFKVTGDYNLNQPLSALGMKSLFNDADLGGIADFGKDVRIYVSQVVHKTYLKLDEKGTEAAAATGIAVEATSAPLKPLEFHADRPFVYFLVNDKTETVLFLGICGDPDGS